MKYFFLAEGWTYDRVWEFGGLWNKAIWGRSPEITKLNCAIWQQSEILWLYQVEDAVIMIEVKPESIEIETKSNIGQVVLKRLISAEQVIEILDQAEKIIK